MQLILTRFIFLLYCSFLWGCARPNYFQQDARYKTGKTEQLEQPKSGYVWATAGRHYQRSTLHNLIWGKHYRPVWAAPVQAPVLNLTQVKGGLQPAAMGGGLQSTSLTLVNPEGRSYTLRTLDKDPSKSLPPFWRKTLLSNIMRDQTSALNPYAAFTIPHLAKAANIYHTNPDLYYVPKDEVALGKYQPAFGGKLAMLEEKYENEKSLTPDFGKAVEVIDTKKLFQQVKKTPDYQVDDLAFARARLFDILISDLDRHEGQWNWVAYQSSTNGLMYKPIPKDRDYAFYQFADGLIPWLITRNLIAGNIKPLTHNMPNVKGLVYKGRKLDQVFLNEISAEDWEKISRELQISLSSQVIRDALTRFPDSVYSLVGEKTQEKLEKRVEQLPQMARQYYKHLAKKVTVTGTEKKEKFVVQASLNNTTVVEVFSVPENPDNAPVRLYHRVFTFPETRKITLDGLNEQDEVVVNTAGRKSPEIKIKARKSKNEIILSHH